LRKDSITSEIFSIVEGSAQAQLPISRAAPEDSVFEKHSYPLVTEYFDQKFLQSKMVSWNRNTQFYVCGDPRMMQQIPQVLRKLAVSEERIHYV
jgi:ferredoxin-NADP reductase